MNQRIEVLDPTLAADVAAKRKWVREHYAPEAEHKYESLEGKLDLLETILESGWIRPDETLKLQCLGITFGDAMAQDLGLTWVAVEDEYGRDPALTWQGTSVVAFPLTTISKRIERGETVDVRELFARMRAGLLEARGDPV